MNRAYLGRHLENAIEAGLKVYRIKRRADGEKRHNGNRMIKGRWMPVISSGADFSGGLAPNGRGFHVEAKETGRTALPISDISDDEIKHMNRHHAIGELCLLVVDFTALCETYAISWEHVAAFLINPWRESLSLDWCRAFGQVVPNSDGVCLFLDGVPHMAATECMAAVEAEKTRPRQAKLFDAPKKISAKQAELRERLNRPSPKTPAEARARILEAADAGMRRVAKGVRK
jgi:penicillin-binding protein-related factor A (putative recombinase)